MKCYITNKNDPFTANVALNKNSLVLNIKGSNETEFRDRTINLADLQNAPRFGDHALLTIADISGNSSINLNTFTLNTITNLYSITCENKLDIYPYNSIIQQFFPIGAILVPFANSSIDEWAICIQSGNTKAISVSSDFTVIEANNIVEVVNDFFPSVKFDTTNATNIQPNDKLEIKFKLMTSDGKPITDKNAEVYLDCTAGYLNKKRVMTTSGQGSVIFRADELSSGDKVKIKCGFKYFSGTDDLYINVV